jgi:membrane-bound serine protease (ClpP class)
MIANMETVAVLIAAGVILLLLETILPGMVAGLVGAVCLLAGVIMGYVTFGPTTGNLILLGVLAGLAILTVLWVRFFPTSRLGQAFVTRSTVGDLGVERPELIHRMGQAITNLRPSGTALIEGRRVDVVTEGGMIERGAAVKVIAVEGLRVVVRAI